MIWLMRSPLLPIMVGVLAGTTLWIAPPAGEGKLKYFMVGLIWFGVAWSAVAGYIYTPNFRIKLTDKNGKEFWSVWAVSCCLGMLATYLALQLPI